MILNFGINNPGIAYEVALEVLGQRMQPLIMAIIEEKTISQIADHLAKPPPYADIHRIFEQFMTDMRQLNTESRP